MRTQQHHPAGLGVRLVCPAAHQPVYAAFAARAICISEQDFSAWHVELIILRHISAAVVIDAVHRLSELEILAQRTIGRHCHIGCILGYAGMVHVPGEHLDVIRVILVAVVSLAGDERTGAGSHIGTSVVNIVEHCLAAFCSKGFSVIPGISSVEIYHPEPRCPVGIEQDAVGVVLVPGEDGGLKGGILGARSTGGSEIFIIPPDIGAGGQHRAGGKRYASVHEQILVITALYGIRRLCLVLRQLNRYHIGYHGTLDLCRRILCLEDIVNLS